MSADKITPEQLREVANDLVAACLKEFGYVPTSENKQISRMFALASALEELKRAEAELAKEKAAHEADNKVANHWLACWREGQAELAKVRGQDAFRSGMRAAAEIAMSAPFGVWSCDADKVVVKIREMVRDNILSEADK